MIGLLAELPQPDYPADYLVARLAARRSRWAAGRSPGAGDDHGGMVSRAAEFHWLYGQLPRRLRRELAPLFVYFELRSLFLFLRGLARGSKEGGKALFDGSLLHDGLRQRLLGEQEAGAAVRRLSRFWPAGTTLSRSYAAGGCAALEDEMTRQVLAAGRRSSAGLRDFWATLIDLENLMAVAKRRRWQARFPFAYRCGGIVGPRLLRKAEHGMVTSLADPMAAAVESAVGEGNWQLEDLLVTRVQQRLARTARTAAPAASVAAYLWGIHAMTRRHAVAAAGGAAA